MYILKEVMPAAIMLSISASMEGFQSSMVMWKL